MTQVETPVTHNFRNDYELLELDDRATWQSAQKQYRHMVHLWHPDRYAQRPRERVHAQQRFIALTKSYHHLRGFYRDNHRLPFQPVNRAKSAAAAAAEADQAIRDATQKSDDSILEASLLGRDPTAKPAAVHSKPDRRWIWLAAALLLLLVTVAAFAVLDRSARQATMEKGREVLRQAPESEFMPSPTEIRKQNSRGAFVK